MQKSRQLKATELYQQFTSDSLSHIAGKTIKDLEYGAIQTPKESHQAEAIILNFTDGSSLCITVQSNAGNLSEEVKGVKPQDFETALLADYHEPGSPDDWHPKPK